MPEIIPKLTWHAKVKNKKQLESEGLGSHVVRVDAVSDGKEYF